MLFQMCKFCYLTDKGRKGKDGQILVVGEVYAGCKMARQRRDGEAECQLL